MDYIGIKDIKDAYANQLVSKKEIDKANKIVLDEIDTPIFNGLEAYGEEEPQRNIIDNAISDISIDLLALNKEFSAIANKYEDMINSTNLRLQAVEEELQIEENRIKDLNTICGNYDEFVSVKTLDRSYFKDSNFGYNDNNTFCAYVSNNNNPNTTIKILDINGNGYEGNKYVYKDGAFLNNSVDTSARKYMIDNHISTAYEYSRLTYNQNTKLYSYPQDVNFDNEEALCNISIYSDNKIGTLKVNTDLNTLSLKDILCSLDNGNTYKSYWDKEKQINNLIGIYNDSNYIYGTGIISFPATNYLKLIFKSNGTTEDKIAYKTLDTTIADKPVDKIIELPDVKRHVIRINSLDAISGAYSNTTNMQTIDLITNPVDSIAIFASEYVPTFFPDNQDYIKYTLSINGKDYNVVPINSNRKGIKVIRFSNITSSDMYVEYINESIKTAKLTIVINTPYNTTTPYISNLKICYGKASIK